MTTVHYHQWEVSRPLKPVWPTFDSDRDFPFQLIMTIASDLPLLLTKCQVSWSLLDWFQTIWCKWESVYWSNGFIVVWQGAEIANYFLYRSSNHSFIYSVIFFSVTVSQGHRRPQMGGILLKRWNLNPHLTLVLLKYAPTKKGKWKKSRFIATSSFHPGVQTHPGQ